MLKWQVDVLLIFSTSETKVNTQTLIFTIIAINLVLSKICLSTEPSNSPKYCLIFIDYEVFIFNALYSHTKYSLYSTLHLLCCELISDMSLYFYEI